MTPRLIAAAISALLIVGNAQAASYSFSVVGFSGGGTLTGSFTGEDQDGKGLISALEGSGEVSAFSLSFSGDSQIGPFTATLSDLQLLAWRPSAGSALGDDAEEGLWVEVGEFRVAAGIGAYGEPGVYVADLSKDAASVARLPIGVVPEPATLALWLAGLGAVSLSRRRRS